MLCLFKLTGDHRELHVMTHSFPTRRSADVVMSEDRDWSRKTSRPLAWKAPRTRAKSASSTGRDRSRPTTSAPSTGESGVTVKDMSKSPIMSGPLYGRAAETEQPRSVFDENSAADGAERGRAGGRERGGQEGSVTGGGESKN